MSKDGLRPSGRDWRVTVFLVATYVLALALGAVALLPDWWVIWAGAAILGLGFLVGWHAQHFAYRCEQCETIFTVPALVDFASPQGIGRGPDGDMRGWKLLRCPTCGRWRRATVVRRVPPNGGVDG